MQTTTTTARTVLVAIDVRPGAEATDAEIAEAVEARLDLFAGTVPIDVRVAVTTPEVAEHMGGALWVGLGNEDDLGDRALTASHAIFPNC